MSDIEATPTRQKEEKKEYEQDGKEHIEFGQDTNEELWDELNTTKKMSASRIIVSSSSLSLNEDLRISKKTITFQVVEHEARVLGSPVLNGHEEESQLLEESKINRSAFTMRPSVTSSASNRSR